MRIVSGIQPTGNLHLGNYLGAIRNWVRMQEEHEAGTCLFFLADLHAISMPHVPADLSANTREMVAALVAWLASEECSFSTGAVYDLSGGRPTY